MNISRSAWRVAALSVGAAALAGCGSTASVAPSANAQTFMTKGAQPNRTHSWMLPEAKTAKKLLYVSDSYYFGSFPSGYYNVYVFTYPKGKLVGTLQGINNPAGLCTDSKGDVYITALYGSNIIEYAHGGTTPIKTLSDPGYGPSACSVDPTTGNLAVANLEGIYYENEGNVVVYANASGSPTTYQLPGGSPEWLFLYGIGYDDKGDIYFDGVTYHSGVFLAGELPAGSSTTENVSLSTSPVQPGSVQWDGKHMTFSDSSNGTIYRYKFSGSKGTEVGSTSLDGLGYWVHASWIDGKAVSAPYSGGVLVSTYQYPAGGKATKTIGGSPLQDPYGVAISVAAK
jgi:sugar lactone lactonase YvrE